jgi:imidazole glycerol-phosphate synthase subunit HisH
MSTVTVVDYGMGNLFSVRHSFEHCGAEVRMTDSPVGVLAADLLVLPGVGAFRDGMAGLAERNLVEPICEYSRSGRPMLGICLGMQMLVELSEEFGEHEGLGLIPGRAVAISPRAITGEPHKIPHIGWNELVPSNGNSGFGDPLMSGVAAGSSAYFVHSFNVVPAAEHYRVADCFYGGIRIAAAVRSNRTYGCQFHPEKSGTVGLSIIHNFLCIGSNSYRSHAC